MKKILSLAAVFTLLLTLAVSAFAVPSPTVDVEEGQAAADLIEGTPTATDAAGQPLVYTDPVSGESEAIAVEVKAATVPEEQKEDIAEKAKEVVSVEEDEDLKISVVDVTLVLTHVDEEGHVTTQDIASIYFEENPGAVVTVAFVRNDASEVLTILYYDENNDKWDEAKDVTVNGNTVTAGFEHFCTVAFILKEAEPAPNPPVPTATPKPGTKTPAGRRSPQTGNSSALWLISAVCMLACACVCVAGARKVSSK